MRVDHGRPHRRLGEDLLGNVGDGLQGAGRTDLRAAHAEHAGLLPGHDVGSPGLRESFQQRSELDAVVGADLRAAVAADAAGQKIRLVARTGRPEAEPRLGRRGAAEGEERGEYPGGAGSEQEVSTLHGPSSRP
ncbi:hypothetical protein D3C86_1675450 [compost metagenome]